MKAIRSLEQHVDSLMSYDFSHLKGEELLEELKVVDDRRIWKIAEAIRQGISYEDIHRITKIDNWFIDKDRNSRRDGTEIKDRRINSRDIKRSKNA